MWAEIKEYEGKYWVNENGEIKNEKGIILKPFKVGNGYYAVKLWKNSKAKNMRVHRLVATYFIDNPNNFTEVNHINEDKSNNTANNLEWCDRKHNCNYGDRNKKIADYQFKRWARESDTE